MIQTVEAVVDEQGRVRSWGPCKSTGFVEPW